MSWNSKVPNSMNLSFAGCGFLGMYHVGVASCFREYAPQVLLNKISGASAGALAAVALLCDVPLGESTSDILKMVVKARKKTLGPFHPGFDVTRSLKEGLQKMLPEDAYLRCTDRLHVSVTQVSDGENVLLTNFNDNEELITALLCSCFVPFYSGFVPLKFRGVAYIDGGFSDNLPILDDNTITVSPFSGESDICPQDNYFNFMQINLCNTSIAISPNNLYRFTRILFPSPPEVLSKMCQQGFDDALKFLQRNNLSSCTRCLAVQSSFILSAVEPPPSSPSSSDTEEEEMADANTSQSITNTDESEDEVYPSRPNHSFDDCKDCRRMLQKMADGDSLPDAVVVAIQDACDQLNKGIVNWLFRHRAIKFLYFMTVPYVLPLDITIAMLRKVLQLIPKVKNEMQQSFWNLVNFARNLLHKFDKNRHLYSAKFSCQLAITEYNYSKPRVAKHPKTSTRTGAPSMEECEICCRDLPTNMMTGLACGHRFCSECWMEYLTTKIMEEGMGQTISCAAHGCDILVDDQTVMNLVADPKVKLKYQHLITNSFVECNRLLRWCPQPQCTNAIKAQYVDAQPVTCTCSHTYCFYCSENWHDPVRCKLLRKWQKKCDDDSETSNWIAANTKECPRCSVTIEKDGGCNHMVCKNQNCKTDFCWVCLGPWEPHGSSWYNCNRYDEEEAKAARDAQEKSRAALQRYLFYCNRYMNHMQSLKFENKLYASVKEKMEEMQQHNMTWIEVQFLKKAVDVLCQCRQTLMYTYVFAYYLKKNNQSVIFEDNQRDLESATEMLSEYLERDITQENLQDIKQRVQDKYRYCDGRRKVLLEHVHEGYEKEWWEYTE